MSSYEFAEWMAYDRIEPLDPYHTDVMHAQTAHIIYSANRGRKGRKLKLQDFLPFQQDDLRQQRMAKQTWQDQLAMVEVINRAFGGFDHRQKQEG